MLLEEALQENKALFLIDFSISNKAEIHIVIDGDNGVSLQECMRVSRHIEHHLDRDATDFSLTVTTPDITKPIVNTRQYNKNIGRILTVQTPEESYEGRLTEIDDKGITLAWKTREPKPVGKGKHTVIKQAKIAYNNIKKAIVKIEFNS